MKHKILIIFLSLIILNLFSCRISKEEMEKSIVESFQKKMDTDADYKEYGMKVQKVGLIKTAPNFYEGIVTVLMDDNEYNISITVKTDSNSYMWETKEGAFNFLLQKRLKKLGY